MSERLKNSSMSDNAGMSHTSTNIPELEEKSVFIQLVTWHTMSALVAICYICVYLTLYLLQFIYLGESLNLEDNNQ